MIQLKNVSKSYGTVRAVDNLSLTIPEGEIMVLIGPSGCGKTTTLEMINGLVKPDAGEVHVDGENVAHTDRIRLRRRIGYVIQEVGLFPHYDVFKNIALIPGLLKWEESKIRQRVRELVRLINLDESVLSKYPTQLSGGQQQRVGVARALAADPGYLLMDEPFGALDPVNRQHLQDEFLRIQQQVKKTVVFVTHDISEALKIGDRIAIMQAGRLVQTDTPLNILKNPANAFVEEFVGADRHLKLLQFLRVEEILGEPLPPALHLKTQEIPSRLSELLQQQTAGPVWIVDSDNRYLGYGLLEDAAANDTGRLSIRRDVSTVTPDTNLERALGDLLMSPFTAVPVVDRENRLLGVITLLEFRRRTREKLVPERPKRRGSANR